MPSAAAAAGAQNAQNAENARTAQSAQTAQNASTVGGIAAAKIDYAVPVSPGSETIFSGGGLTLQASCSGNQDIAVTATTTKQDSSIYTAAVNPTTNNNVLGGHLQNGASTSGPASTCWQARAGTPT